MTGAPERLPADKLSDKFSVSACASPSCQAYASLPAMFKDTFNDFRLPVTVFKSTTSEAAVLRVYEDLNCGADNLNKQQARLGCRCKNCVLLALSCP